METNALTQVYVVMIQIGFAATALVCLLYGIVAPWHKTPSGRYIFSLLLSLSLILGVTVSRIYFREFPYTTLLGVVVFAFYIVAVIAMGIGIYNASIKRYLDIKMNKARSK